MTSYVNYFSSPTPYVNEGLPNEFVRKLQSGELTEEESFNFLFEYISNVIQTIPSFKNIYPSVIKSSKEILQSKFPHFNTLTPLHAIDVETSEVKDQIPTDNDTLKEFIENLDEKYIFDFITKIQDMDISYEKVFPYLIRKCNDSNYILNKLVLIKLLLQKNIDFQIDDRQFNAFTYSENQINSVLDIIDNKEINDVLQLLLKDRKSCHITDFNENRDYILLLFNNELMIFDVRENYLERKEKSIDLREKIGEQIVEAYVYDDELHFISISSPFYFSTKDFNIFERKPLDNVVYNKNDTLRVHDDKLFVISYDKITSYKIQSDRSYDSTTQYYYFDDSFVINNAVHRICFSNGKLFHFSYQKLTPGRFSTLLPPMFVSPSYTGASLITLKIIQEMNSSIQAILENKGSRSNIVSNPEQVIEFSLNLYREIVQNLNFDEKDRDQITTFYRVFLLRLIVLCMRQILAKGEKINQNTKDTFVNYIKRFTRVNELLQIIVTLIPNSLYNKSMNDFINSKLISNSDDSVKEMILKFPHSIFFDLKDFLKTKDLQFKTDWLLKSLSAFYYFLNDESLDEELCPFLDTVKVILIEMQKNKDYNSKFAEITSLFLMILSVSKYKDNVARHIVEIFSENGCNLLELILNHKEFKDFRKLDRNLSTMK
ncbi:hypothetical protein TVAG_226940 [Trichomonas vaginalis G3]|uniref:Uncharacterized protein n=1 Tax=Trichomonas vaginalis (strain ATCC PRA-98 / G3) TaxID=412133 RepID=A2FCD8_TRIV3|nr:hypothetical protein TVAG_226940 [Trichomonas vaginalis G3]|eukprot:XP_001310380.1 hypothetical protein [Trichomonas vaginalis G3]